jgi:DNA-binding GntR family transcriptional regulator
LPEEQVRSSLSVSRSTLREGFQLLVRERLLVHELSRGFFVRQLFREDISDLYRVRRIVECAALLETSALLPAHLHGLAKAVDDGTAAAEQEDWGRVATASVRFHESIIALADSTRLEMLMSQVLAEFRLSYAYMTDPLRFHAAFLRRNQEIAQFIQTGDLGSAATALRAYLDDAEKALLAQYDAS